MRETGVPSRVSVWPRATLYASSAATGASLTGRTLIVTVAVREAPGASVARTRNVSVPLKLRAGVYKNEPSAWTVATPWTMLTARSMV